MPELKRNFTKGKMNKDLDERMVPNGEYRDALNIEVATSEGANVGAVQTTKGNKNLTNLFGANATCVGVIGNGKTNKIYWLVSSPDKNTEASKTYAHVEEDSSGTVSVVHNVYSDYIMEYDEENDNNNYITVENYKVESTISNDSHGTNSDHIHVTDFNSNDIRDVGIQPGMDITIRGVKTCILKIEKDAAPYSGWRVYTKHTAADQGWENLNDVVAGDSVTFELPFNKRALGFTHFASEKPKKLITGINIIDDLLFWTDGITEPKKINIERSRYGSQHLNPAAYPNGTNKYYTLLIVNGQPPSPSNGRLSTDDSNYVQGFQYMPLTYRETTVIKKSPTTALKLIMSNTTRADIVVDGSLIVNANVNLPFGNAAQTSSNFFFDSVGVALKYGNLTPALHFGSQMDWQVGDFIEFYPDDDDAGNSNDVLILAKVETAVNADTFIFEIRTISLQVVKTITTYRAKLKQKKPLFEFKFPRFAYRWRYEDGEYSTYSPFSEIAFLPEKFDYLPKKGFNLGMTNNLRYLMLSGFKPTTTPLDVVEIDVLYKESNSPNVYTVETIKSPSGRNDVLGTDSFAGDKGWFGLISHNGNWSEGPNTKTTVSHMVGQNNFDGTIPLITSAGVYFYGMNLDFGDSNMKIGDTIVFTGGFNSGLTGPIIITGIRSVTSPTTGLYETSMSFKANGTPVNLASPPWISPSSSGLVLRYAEVEFFRTIAKRPAFDIDYPNGSLEVDSDMIHATLPSNQLLRPWDNVPIKALSQEITGNRIVYGNYTQNYNLVDDKNDIIKNSFQPVATIRKNVRQNVRYNDATTLRDPSTGAIIDYWDIRNAVIESPAMPERSIKSLRDYQVGVVYMDEFGRQTPIQTHETGVLKLAKDEAARYNQLTFHLRDADDSTQTKNARYPEWASHYKYYIKENSNEYYNLAMDRFYDAEDGNIWLSFPSSERNKVDDETFLILKKRHDSNIFVVEDARFKILAIADEAPLFVKTKTNSFGIIGSNQYQTGGEPKVNQQHVDIESSFFATNGAYEKVLSAKNRVIRFSNATNTTKFYEIVNIVNVSNFKRVTLRKPLGTDVSFTTDDGTALGTFIGNISLEIAEREIKNLAEFEGRFFVKVLKNATLEKNILADAVQKTYITSSSVNLGRLRGRSSGGNILVQGFWDDEVPWKKWFVDETISEGIHVGDPGGYNSQSNYYHGQGLHNSSSSIDLAYHGFQNKDQMSKWDPPWHILDTSDPGVSSYNKSVANSLLNIGQLFRWTGDTTIYRITNATSHSVENWNAKENGRYRDASNHREKFKVDFTPALGVSGINDAVGNPTTGYNPFNDKIPDDGDSWNRYFDQSNYDQRNIEFLEEFIGDSSYSSDNPAIWETEPKENIDVDIYNEASDSLPIKYEWSPFLNKFVFYTFYRSWNPIDYYNCFSFNNGVESNRVRDDFNAVTIDKGPKVSTVLAEQYKEEQRKSGLIYSGIYNSTSGVNNLNQFIQAEKITKDINPTYGSIQKLFSRDTDLVTLCEDRVIRVLANKDAVFNADGNINLTSTNNVLGQATPYAGDYGISTNPESFAVDQYRAYFTDKSRGAVIRLSMDGLTPISDIGMRDWFKDSFKRYNLSLLGSYDQNKKVYNLTVDTTNPEVIKEFASSSPPAGSAKTYFGVTGNGGNGLVPGSVITKDWAPFDINNNVNFNPSSISFIDVAVNDYDGVDQTAWLATLKTAVDAGNAYNLAIGIDDTEGYGGGPVGENIFTITSVSAPALSVTGVLYYRVQLTHDSGAVDLHSHRAYIIYYLKASSVGKKDDVTSPYTVSFSEDTKGWTSFASWIQETGISINDKFFTFKGAELFQQHSNETRNNFYGEQYDSRIIAVFNDMPSSVKNFGSLSYEGSQSKIDLDLTDQEYYNNTTVSGWYAELIETDLETGFVPEFKEKEGKWFNYIRGNQENTLDNLNVKQFSTQGIGTPSGVALFASGSTVLSKLTTKDVGDND